ncbi:alpha-glucan family phosphorylase [Rhodocaloribacter litoris]|uniref:alpha-glucan family phosphorylase n=1 Tax=Rhodocaloribacter litoris TaxID=2558931 RepID=UPI001422576A|nr:alpha-glucan family phosphorylase [Rhodocaloribacter litoris]QXD16448.1 alpha-glucan family phosphorylase [Rhodocaloribacter litoris]
MTTREKLTEIATNLWWSWNPEALDLFRRLNPGAFDASDHNPVAALRHADPAVLEDTDFQQAVDVVYDTFARYLNAPPHVTDAPRVAYFCMEYGLHESLPFYSGGLGILAGDHTKAASDLGLPLTAVGLFLRDGYFKQFFDVQGRQRAEFPGVDTTELPLQLVTDAHGNPVTVTVPTGWQVLHLRAWRLALGRINLYLLDTDFSANPFTLRFLTRRLYQGDRTTRIQQEIILGIGGIRMLRALGVEVDVYHLNEGHCAFLTLELLREALAEGRPRHDAETAVRERCVFTTHTPVKAGHDRFDPGLFLEQMRGFQQQIGLSDHDLLAYGRINPNDTTEAFTMTVLGLKLSRKANGVSKLNGEVARRQWHALYPDRPVDEVPISHVTNGVHLPTWTAPHARPFLRIHLGDDWLERRDDPAVWKKIQDIPDEALWAYRRMLRERLIHYIQERIRYQTLPQTAVLDPDVLTIGFARRFATYKRATLFFLDRERALDFFRNTDRPIQMIYAGKAHPDDEGGKALIREIYEMTKHPEVRGKLVFVEGYDMAVGRMLTSGCDVWLNNPRRPYEASGTSGQKVAVHGGLNLSILDGWWPEGYDGTNGWAIGREASHLYKDPQVQDPEDAHFLYQTLEQEVLPAFYERDERGLPPAWIARMRRAMERLPYAFSAHRMVIDYVEQIYRTPATQDVPR